MVKAAPAPISAAAVAQPPAEADPLAPLRPHLAEALSKVRTAAGPLGLLGWPGVATDDGSDESNPTLEQLFFHNDRALVFADEATGRYSALVLMPESHSTEELHYWPIWVHDLFGSPKLERANFENPDRNQFDASRGLWWNGGDSTKRDAPRTEEEKRLHEEESFHLVVGNRGSDDMASYLAGAMPLILDWVDGVTDAQGLIEGFPADAQPDMDRTLPRKDVQSAQKLGESKRFVWFSTGGKTYAAEKADWEAWTKGPAPLPTQGATP
ncbi:MAG TPA: hypothetical protein VFF77_07550 [Holophagaceae bacterium]|nr:hypothetical protein [Holophagaceae bacterium]